jgi:hypothetical protein
MSDGRDAADRSERSTGEDDHLPVSDDHERLPSGDDRDRRSARDDRPTTRGDEGLSARRGGRADRPQSADSLAEAVERSAGRPSTVETRGLTATLVGVPRIDLAEFVYDHQLDPAEEGRTRPVALFDLENTSERPLRWRDARTAFVGDDDYPYQPAHLSLDPAALGPGCHTRQVEIEPGRRARLVTLVEELPAGVEVSEVVHTHSTRRGEDQRLVFSVK